MVDSLAAIKQIYQVNIHVGQFLEYLYLLSEKKEKIAIILKLIQDGNIKFYVRYGYIQAVINIGTFTSLECEEYFNRGLNDYNAKNLDYRELSILFNVIKSHQSISIEELNQFGFPLSFLKDVLNKTFVQTGLILPVKCNTKEGKYYSYWQNIKRKEPYVK